MPASPAFIVVRKHGVREVWAFTREELELKTAVPCRYNLTRWAIQLNEITPGLKEKLAPTDCRLRPDQHHLELGEYDQASPFSICPPSLWLF